MLNSNELSKLICKCLSNDSDVDNFEETKIILYNELAQISNDSFIKVALLRLCEKIENLEK